MNKKLIGWIAIIYGIFFGYAFLGAIYLDLIPNFDLTNSWFYLISIYSIFIYLVPAILLIYLGSNLKKN